eukprot:TRINITY_DN857_c0_g1_i1.p1 TRINITY_DN857_c0_g1~~TRINITY_DN857_c0_g1_i1.p1  ORF type:complete len:908 (+),score=295.53 TRINITY_DN857_c0_g1_i1:84-2807(+)
MSGDKHPANEGDTKGVVSLQVVLALLCLSGIVITGVSVAVMSEASCSSALDSTEEYGDTAKTQCFEVSQESLKATAVQMLQPAQASLRTQAVTFFEMAIVEAARFRGFINLPDQASKTHDWDWVKDSMAWMWSNIQNWRKNGEMAMGGPPFLGPYPRENGPSPFGGLGLVVEDTPNGVVISERTMDGIRTGVTAFSNPDVYPGYGLGGQHGITDITTGLPMLHLPPPLSGNITRLADASRGVQSTRIRPRVYPVGEGRFMMIETLGDYLGTAYIYKQQDPSNADQVFEVLVLLPLTTLEDYMVRMSATFCSNETLVELKQCLSPRLYLSVRKFWLAETLKERGDPNWAREVQTDTIVAASHGGSSRKVMVPNVPFPLAFPIKDVESQDNVIQNVAMHIHTLPESYETIHKSEGFIVDNVIMNHTTNVTDEYFIGVTDVHLPDGVDWWLTIASDTRPILYKIQDKQADLETLIAAEKKLVKDDVSKNSTISWIVMVVIVIVLGVTAIAAANAILQPILDVQKAMACVAQMELDIVTRPTSLMTEVNHMQADFAKMVANLIEFRAFMPVVLPGGDDDDSASAEESMMTDSRSRSMAASKNSRSKRSVKSSNGTSVAAKKNKLNQMRLGHLAKHQVVVLSLGSDALATGKLSADELSAHCEAIVALVVEQAGTFKGAPEFGDGTNLTVTWGLVGARGDLALKAARLAVTVTEMFKNLEQGGNTLRIGVARAVGVYGGTVGSAKMRKITGVGQVYDNAQKLRMSSAKYESNILCDGATFSVIKFDFVARPVDVLLRMHKGKHDREYMAGIYAAQAKEEEEWMYQMENTKDVILEAWDRFVAEEPSTCLQDIEKALTTADDATKESISAVRLLELVKSGVNGRLYAQTLTLSPCCTATISPDGAPLPVPQHS